MGKYNQNSFIYAPFSEDSPTSSTDFCFVMAQMMQTYARLCLLGFHRCYSLFWDSNPPKTQLWGRKYADSSQIHSHIIKITASNTTKLYTTIKTIKYEWSNYASNKPEVVDSCHVKNIDKNCHFQQRFVLISTKFCIIMQHRLIHVLKH